MTTPLFVWLGSGRARRRHVSPKGQYLDQASRAGLPVPPGAILLDELWRTFRERDLIIVSDGRITIPDPELFHNTLFYSVRLPRFDRKVAVRSAIDNKEQSIPPRLNVDMNDAVQVASTLVELWTAILRAGSERMDIMVMDMISAEHSGMATSRHLAEVDEAILSGMSGMSLPLPRSGHHYRAGSGLPDYARRLHLLLGGTRRTFGKGDWRIDWLDDGQICYLIQVAPLANAGQPGLSTA